MQSYISVKLESSGRIESSKRKFKGSGGGGGSAGMYHVCMYACMFVLLMHSLLFSHFI